MLHRRTIIAAAGLLLIAAAPVGARDATSPNDTARILAGMSVPAESPLAPLMKDGSWQSHARTFDGAFERLDKQQLSHIRTWSAANLAQPRPTLFYMFSGPDFLYANAFFPNAKTYVLAGLEPVGTVPDLATMRGSIGGNLAQLRSSLSTILSVSFFITARMKSDLRAGRVNGTLPILYVFLARSGKTVRDVSMVRLDEEGVLQPDSDGVRGNPTRGVKIVFAGSDGEERTLYYFSTNLEDGGVKSSKFLKFLETMAPGDGFVKSASYLLHSGGFSKVREFLLANTTTMVQDDTGIPLAYYDPKKWDLRPFGRYLGPIGVFPGRYQGKYAELFRKSRAIDFGIGYRHHPNESNVLVAVRTAEISASDAPTQSVVEDDKSAEKPASQVRHRRAPARQPVARSPMDWFRFGR
jgi:hypothetical protein